VRPRRAWRLLLRRVELVQGCGPAFAADVGVLLPPRGTAFTKTALGCLDPRACCGHRRVVVGSLRGADRGPGGPRWCNNRTRTCSGSSGSAARHRRPSTTIHRPSEVRGARTLASCQGVAFLCSTGRSRRPQDADSSGWWCATAAQPARCYLTEAGTDLLENRCIAPLPTLTVYTIHGPHEVSVPTP
jgi:hypothetical protein